MTLVVASNIVYLIVDNSSTSLVSLKRRRIDQSCIIICCVLDKKIKNVVLFTPSLRNAEDRDLMYDTYRYSDI